MNQKYFAGCFTLIVVAIGLIVLSGMAYTVNMREQVVITQFGEPKGDPVTEAGLK
ncbi:MAG: protease modulator HflC, partial [Roseibacillus sp.]|nr:protease modulator HflC [Roseibacillus sp.]